MNAAAMASGAPPEAIEPVPDAHNALVPSLDPNLVGELVQAEAHLRNSAVAARAQATFPLAQSIDAVRREAQDLTRIQMRSLRIAASVTQAELARRVGVPRQVVSGFEAGKRTVLPDVVRAMVEAVGPVEQPALRRVSTALRMAQTALAGEETRAFEVVASGISMEPAIHHGDRLLVSGDVKLEPGRIVVAMHGDACIVKRLVARRGVLVLRSDNVDEEVELSEVTIQGVVVELRRTV
jgi:SOS-response transcriptional repressor LexA